MSRRGTLRFASREELEQHMARARGGDDVPALLEAQIVPSVLAALRCHPSVAWAARINTGGARLPGRDHKDQFVKFAFKGCSDILGMMKGGRLIACEVKRPGEEPTDDQA